MGVLRSPKVRDALLWAVLGLPVWWAVATSHQGRFAWWECVIGLAVVAGALALRRRRPSWAVFVALAAWALATVARSAPTEVGLVAMLPLAVATSYSAGVRVSEAHQAVAGFAWTTAGVSALVAAATRDDGAVLVAVIGIAFLGTVPWLVGRHRRQYRDLVWAGWERAEQLEREQRIIAEQARLRERTRIAGDMHDLLGHELSLVALRIGGLEVAPDLDSRHREVAGEARAAVTSAAQRLREVVEMLREEPPPLTPGGSVRELVERAETSGMRIHLAESGEPADTTSMRQRAVCRVAQEALTNAAKHAPGAEVSVRVEHEPGETRVLVANPATGEGGGGGGYGLVALAERVRLAGGEFHAGERGGEFTVHARIPQEAQQIAPAPEGSESAARLAAAQRKVRSSRTVAIAVATGCVVGLATVSGAIAVYDAVTSVLSPADYQRLRPGQSWADVEPYLPSRTRIDDPPRRDPPRPPGAECLYYSTHHNPFDERRLELYRLCFRADVLVGKDFIAGR
ncbi:sensor histidine kinase [Saccharopolyspora erythraea]|uniref:histidine kinase n=1 Tax=Saccharopolyspora erythraea (strain ATCC 11635 / DSM 40517 / JCM 4748 / NBRC 13426 / NCIMB 8594 / NRRL 2338) TaxID=405948 RepID=A4FQ98_SACEN|nr:histidine kinase [Saccharopolyspora erythraea]EQD86324.1 histidine kinase [Saccharopolyspora erythraea D]QRK89737.1 two-component sensor histidine kinase [Saccharopolyspora erythraea]CAM06223.1 two component system sensor kinase [Saccharopolyspora erythraea NRRL 2338]